MKITIRVMEFDRPAAHENNPTPAKHNLRLKVVQVSSPDRGVLLLSTVNIAEKQNTISKTSNKSGAGEIQVRLEGVWAQNNISTGTIVHLVNPTYDKLKDQFIVNNSAGLLVVEPDSLLTCTLVASSLFCERKTWLNNVFLGQVGTNRAMLVGTLVHEVFQYGLKHRQADIDKLTAYLDELLDDATVMLETYSVELHLKDIRNEAITYISSVKEWIDKYLFSGPRFPLTNEADLEVKVTNVDDIEENVWSTKYGLKGKIDVTGSVRIYDRRTKSLENKKIPLELKTGKPVLSASHAAQVSLYSLMIEDRYSETNQGFVIYLKDKANMYNVALTHNIKRDLIQRRNQINYHMKNYFNGPDMIDNQRMCKNCERLTECILIDDIYSPGKINHYSDMKLLEADAIGHLDDEFKLFFKKYHEKLTSLMMKTIPKNPKDEPVSVPVSGSFWTYSSEEAETNGTGFGKLQATKSDNPQYITFRRHPKCDDRLFAEPSHDVVDFVDLTKPAKKKQKIQDYFKPIKTSPVKNGVAKNVKVKPFNTEVNFSHTRFAISLDHDVQNMDSRNSSTGIAIGFINDLKSDTIVMKLYEGSLELDKSENMYRIDRIEKRSQIDIERTVLVRLLARDDWRCDRIRQFILDPQFKPSENAKLNLFILSTNFEEISELDAKQQKFVVEAASTNNYYILNEQIEPKRSDVNKVVASLTSIINVLDRSVLIVAQNIDKLVDLMRLLQAKKIRFILIDDGKSQKARYQFASNLVKVPKMDKLDVTKKFDTYIKVHEMATVVITTYAMSVGGLLFTRKTFDYCVAYDCDTTELLVSLSPMFCSDRYIIIDHQDNSGDVESSSKSDVTLGQHLRQLRPI